MIINITKDNFVNNMYEAITESGCIITFNSVQEHYSCLDAEQDKEIVSEVNAVNIQLSLETNEALLYKTLPCVIGLSDKYISIDTKHEELLGKAVTLDNIDKCTFTISRASLKDEI